MRTHAMFGDCHPQTARPYVRSQYARDATQAHRAIYSNPYARQNWRGILHEMRWGDAKPLFKCRSDTRLHTANSSHCPMTSWRSSHVVCHMYRAVWPITTSEREHGRVRAVKWDKLYAIALGACSLLLR